MHETQHRAGRSMLDKRAWSGLVRGMRDRFVLPEDLAYYDAAHMGLLPRAAARAAEEAMALRAAPWSPSGAETVAEDVRLRFGRLIGATAGTIALGPSTAYWMTLAAAMIPLDGRALLHLEDEHPSSVLPWRRAAAAGGAAIRPVPRPADGDWTRAVLACIDRDVGVVCLPQCHWLDGIRLDLVAIGAAARSAGARLVVDATQSAGARTIDVGRIQPDLLAVSGYKWLFGPIGVAHAYIAPTHHDRLPLEDGFAQRNTASGWFAGDGSVRYLPRWKAEARRFDAGGMYDPVKLALAQAGLALFDDVAVERIERELLDRAGGLMADHPQVRFAGPVPSHILSFRPAAVAAAMTHFERAGVRVSRRGPHIRIAGHVWNDDRDRARLSEALEAVGGQATAGDC